MGLRDVNPGVVGRGLVTEVVSCLYALSACFLHCGIQSEAQEFVCHKPRCCFSYGKQAGGLKVTVTRKDASDCFTVTGVPATGAPRLLFLTKQHWVASTLGASTPGAAYAICNFQSPVFGFRLPYP